MSAFRKVRYILLVVVLVSFIWPTWYSGANSSPQDHIESGYALSPSQPAEVSSPTDYIIQLRSGHFDPEPGIDPALAASLSTGTIRGVEDDRIHVLVQLYRIPTLAERKLLESVGMKLLNYIPRNTWFASVPVGEVQSFTDNLTLAQNVRWIGYVKPEFKAPSEVADGRALSGITTETGDIRLAVSFFSDVAMGVAESVILRNGGLIESEVKISNKLYVSVPPSSMPGLLLEDTVRWIDRVPPPPVTNNDGARSAVNVDIVQAAPYNLSGQGVMIGIWDGGAVDWTHDDFARTDGTSRVISRTNTIADHATHVAGTMAGNGTRSEAAGGTDRQWRGMAPNADLVTYDFNDPTADYSEAIGVYGAAISQNSWGSCIAGPQFPVNACGRIWPFGNCDDFGDYRFDAPDFDRLVRGQDEGPITMVFSVGNDRDDGDCGMSGSPPYVNYGVIAPPSTAKNVISVGAVNSDDRSMTAFSSWGPVDDGRVKPEVVAPGCEAGGEQHIHSTLPGNTYGGPDWCGTSMAAPAVSGVSALLVEQYRALNGGSNPLPSTIKATLVQTAHDLDDSTSWYNPGPDYASGYGLIDAQAAVDLIRARSHVTGSIIVDNQMDLVYLNVPSGTSELKVTLAWDDPAGMENADPAWVNDIDLLLWSSTSTYYPYVLDPANPSAPATFGKDSINNLEQISVRNPEAGRWTVVISGTHVPETPQLYSVAFEGGTRIEPGTVDVSLIIDSSGSMSSNDPQGMRKEGAKVFVDTAQNGDEIAVVDFATTAFARWPMTPLTNDRTAVKAAIDQIPSNGSSTNIGGGLQVGYTQLQAGNADHQKAAVLMTDGQHNAGTNPSVVVPLYQAAGWPIHTIGLGSGVNQQMLQQIADATGGTYTYLSNPNDLIRVYFEIVGAILGGTTVFNQQYPMQQGETVLATVGVPANQSQVTFLVNWPGSRVDTTLTTPSGQEITPQTVDPNVYHAQGLTYELYRITNPESGDWIVTMYGTDLPPGGEMVELTVNAIGPTAVAPTANAGGPYSGIVGQPVLFDGSASFDPDGSITQYEWDFDNDGTFDYSSPDPTAIHIYGAPYNGTVILRVTDNEGNSGTGVASVTIEAALVCNDAPEGFDAGARAVGWGVLTSVAGGPEWADLNACGPYPNWTNGAGDAACVSVGNITLQPFDTELRSPVFSLAGYAEAYLNYQANYQNWASQDQLDLDISSDGGVTWTTLRSWQEDHGAPYSLPGENVTINLMPYLGESNLMVRWRYYAPSGQGLGYYAQLDDVRLNCTEIPPTAVTISEMTSVTSQSPLPAASLPLAGLPAAAGLALVAAAWLRRKR